MKHVSLIALTSTALALFACSEASNDQLRSGEALEDGTQQSANLDQESVAPVMRVSGRTLLDSSGKPVVLRGIEGWYGPNTQSSAQNMHDLIDGMAAQGFNAVRLQTITEDLALIEPLIQYAHSKGMVFFLNDDGMEGVNQEEFGDFLGRADVQAMVERHRHNMVIDVTIEEPEDAEGYEDENGQRVTSEETISRWVAAQKDAIRQVRSWGYTQPLVIGTLNHGRYLRGLIDYGAEIIASDPEGSIILNCQMYWGDYSGDFSYQSLNGYSQGEAGIREAASEVAAQPFLIQWGLDAVDDGGNNALVPYELLMSESEQNSIGTMFWEWRDPDDNNPNSLVYESLDPTTLTDLGQVVINTHPASIKNTAHPVEDFPTPLVEFPSEPAPGTAEPDDNEPGEFEDDDERGQGEPDPIIPDELPVPPTVDAGHDEDSDLPESCAEVPEKFVGIGDGCDCPADGERRCDSDCAVDNAGGGECGCEYCYPQD